MSVATAQGHASQAGIIIPELWMAEVQEKFWKLCVFKEIASTELVKPLQKGGADTAHIRTYPSFTVRDETIGEKLITEDVTMSIVDFSVDKPKYISARISKIEEVQSDLNLLNIYTKAMGKDMAVDVDAECFSTVATQAASANQGATAGVVSGRYNLGATGAPVAITEDNALKSVMKLVDVVAEQNIDPNEMWVAIPQWMAYDLKIGPLMYANEMGTGKSSAITGLITEINGVKIYVTNNGPTVLDGTTYCYYALAGHKSAIAFAEQLNEFRTTDPSDEHATFAQMFYMYGVKTVNADAMGMLYCYPTDM